jgi:hypothetical protein
MRLAILGIILGCVWIARNSPLDLSPTDDSRQCRLAKSEGQLPRFLAKRGIDEQVFSAPEQVLTWAKRLRNGKPPDAGIRYEYFV